MKFIGLLMINHENDVLERTLEHNTKWLDSFYVLDGTLPNDQSEDICRSHPKCDGYMTDVDLPRPPYGRLPVCGWRQAMLELAYQDHGFDNWFLVLHGDEVWVNDPRLLPLDRRDGFVFQLPFFFPRDGEPWDDSLHPLDQLRWSLWPGYPEFRMFKGGRNVRYNVGQQFNTRPHGIIKAGMVDDPILHYPYRQPAVQRARAAIHEQTRFDPDNYQHIVTHDRVYWTDQMIQDFQTRECFRELRHTQVPVAA